jgi:hypothetical protein
MSKRFPLAVSLGLMTLGMAAPASAIPAFARRYEVECHFCHEGYPKLNPMGQRFKERGFRMENEQEFDGAKWLAGLPASLRATGTRLVLEDAEDGAFGFFKPIAAGNLGPRVSFWADLGLIVRSETLTPPGGETTDFLGVSNAWARLEVVRGGRLYARAGRIELDLPFTQIRTPNLLSYDIYLASTGAETDTIAEDQDGVEIGGNLPADVHWSAALVRGHDADFVKDLDAGETDRFEANLFLRLAKRVGRHRLGTFAYIGRNHLALPGVSVDPGWKNDILRVGVDGSVWVRRFNLYGVAMYGRNSNAIATVDEPTGTDEEQDFSGGFLQADLHARDYLAITARFNLVSSGDDETVTSFVPGVRLHVRDRLRLAFEYAFFNEGRPGFGAVQADLAF